MSEKQAPFIASLKSTVLMYATAFVTLIITACYSAYFLITDPDPPLLPVSSKDSVVDCSFIKTSSIASSSSRISFNASVGDFLQFPRPAAMSLLRVVMKTGSSTSTYTIKQFWDTKSYLSSIFFNILHPYQGNARIQVMCGNKILDKRDAMINDVTVYSVGWSRILAQDFCVSEICDGCYHNGSFVIASPSSTVFEPMITSVNSMINVNMTYYSAAQYATMEKIDFIKENPKSPTLPNIFFLAANPKLGFQKIIDVLLPLWTHTYFSRNLFNQTLVLTNNQEDQIDSISPMFEGRIILSNESLCFGRGVVLPSSSSQKYNEEKSIYQGRPHFSEYYHLMCVTRLKSHIISQLRSLYTKKKMEKNRITVDSNARSIIPIIQKLFPQVHVEVISDTDSLKVIANNIAKSHIFIATTAQRMAYSIFLEPGAVIVEMQPVGMECVRAGEQWAAPTQTRYVPLGRSINSLDECTAKTFEDYFRLVQTAEYPLITPEMVHKALSPFLL